MTSFKINNFCKKLGIRSGDTLMIHGDIGCINQLIFNRRISLSQKLEIFIKQLKKKISKKGNLLIPTFTYKFCKKKFVNLDVDNGEVGLFSEFCRKLKFGKRTSHPIFSYKVFGSNFKFFENSNKKTCFGNDSLFDRFDKINGKIIFLGCNFDRMTFIHHVEQSFGVNYRYLKKFNGNVKYNKKLKKVFVEYYVRKLSKNKNLNLNHLFNLMYKFNKIKIFELGRYNVLLVNANDVKKFANQELKKNPNFLVLK